MAVYDITFEQDQLDRADTPADWGDEIPVDGAPLPVTADPAAAPPEAERLAADAFDGVYAETGDLFAAWDAMDEALRRNGRGWTDVAEDALDACAAGHLPVADAGVVAATALERADAAMPLATPGGSRMWKR